MSSPDAVPFDDREFRVVQLASFAGTERMAHLKDRLRPAANSRFMCSSGDACRN